MADYELIGLNEAAPDLRAPTAADTGVVSNLTVTGVLTSSSGEVVGAGTSPETTPLNQYLGGMAFQSPESVVIKPQAVAFPNGVGDMVFQATSDSVIELEYKGSDAVVRTAQVPMNNERLVELSRVTPLRQAVRVAMTAAASGSNGIQVPDNANLNMGTNNFTLHWEGSLPDWTPAANARLAQKISAGSSPFTGWSLDVLTTGVLSFALYRNDSGVVLNSTVSTGLADGSLAKISVVITRETASAAGSVVFYINGVQLGAAVSISSAATFDLSNANVAYFNGTGAGRTASDTTNAIIYNRALSAAEVLSLCVNGPALADIGASQVAFYESNFPSGVSGWSSATFNLTAPVDAIESLDGWLRMSVTNDTLAVRSALVTALVPNKRNRIRLQAFVPSGQSVVTGFSLWINNAATIISNNSTSNGSVVDIDLTVTPTASDLRVYANAGAGISGASGQLVYVRVVSNTVLGITGQWSAEDAQSNTGQIFDSSGNKNHALLPAAGATIIGKPVSGIRQVRWTNTWAGTNELQYIGGVNQAILPANAYIDSIVGVITGATVEDIIIGDGSDTDRYVTITTGLAAGTTTFTLANRTTDGTNLKLTVDPDANATMSIAWTITYRTLE